MNSYERIQKAVDHIEKHLTDPIELDRVAVEACFSPAHLYRMFHALTGHPVKQYVRKRRLSEAARRLAGTHDRLIDICMDYQFEYQESFTRAFKAMFGVTPGVFRKNPTEATGFPALNLFDKYYVEGEVNLLDPRIKVLKRLEPMRVAWCRAVSRTPERDAMSRLLAWAERKQVIKSDTPYRVFGFDNPGPIEGKAEYGYEVWLTVGPGVAASDEIEIKTFEGGRYAVTGTTVAQIGSAWKHFVNWLGISRYRAGSHRCLEECLSPPEVKDEKMQIDLYLPIEKP